jgi:hypothetical protein
MSIETWDAVLEWLEDVEDRLVVKEAIPKLRVGPQKAGALRWEEIKAEWN